MMSANTPNRTRPLHIGINALQVRAAKSGVGQYIAGLVGALLDLPEFNEAGHRLTLFVTPENAANYQYLHPRFQQRIWGASEKARLPERRLREWLLLPGAIRKEGIDLWHGPSNFLPLTRIGGCRYVVTLHDVSYWLQPDRVTTAKRLYWRAWTARTVQVADGIITASRHSRQTIGATLGLSSDRFALIPHAAHERFRPIKPLQQAADAWWLRNESAPDLNQIEQALFKRLGINPGGYILSICTLEPGKNLKNLVRAYDLLIRENNGDSRFDGLHLVLVGDRGWLLDSLFEEIGDSIARDRIKITGHLPDAELPLLLNGAGAFGFLSYNEGFGLPPLEALACGTPVVASNASSLPEVLGNAALSVEPNDCRGAAKALKQVLTNSDVRNHHRIKGPKQASKYSWENTAHQTLAYYQAIAE